ncbi:MAG: hypothetical protein JSR75_07795 [Proteobacteria bacterium]|nr:hypothetical protein [Pseudomonadota bacterium]
MNAVLERLWWRGVRRIGASGMVALGLLLPIGALLGAGWFMQQRSESLRADLVAKAREVAAQTPLARRALTPAEQLGSEVAAFPPLAQNAADLEQVFAAAQARRIALLKGDYQLKADPGAPLITFTATFPVRHEYAAVKGFTADVLSALPHVSMDELRMARADAGTGTLDSIVRFTFVYRNP